jgi:medium-chain acyl-[acyl-carrier-protein] hydrolase
VTEPPGVDPEAVAAAVRADRGVRPYALFGHSMGALLAFELAHLLSGDGQPAPVYLAVSGAGHPRSGPVRRRVSTLAAPELLAWAESLGGLPDQVLADPQMRELLLPPLRADCAWLEGYVHRNRPPLPCPLSVFAGDADDHAPRRGIAGWAHETTGRYCVRQYPGGHFYLAEHLPTLLGDLAEDLTAALRDAGPGR